MRIPWPYLLIREWPNGRDGGGPPRYFIKPGQTLPSWEALAKKRVVDIIGHITNDAEFINGRLLSGRAKAIAMANILNLRVGRIRTLSRGGYQSAPMVEISSREIDRLAEDAVRANATPDDYSGRTNQPEGLVEEGTDNDGS